MSIQGFHETAQTREEAEHAAFERARHDKHDCHAHSCPPAPCAIHGIVDDSCDERCLEASRPDLFV